MALGVTALGASLWLMQPGPVELPPSAVREGAAGNPWTPVDDGGADAPAEVPGEPPARAVPLPPDQPVSLSGTVVTTDGAAASEATVFVLSSSPPRDFAQTETDAWGRFSFFGLQQPVYDVVVSRGDERALEQGVSRGVELKMELYERGRVEVRVLDERGRPEQEVDFAVELPPGQNPMLPQEEIQARLNDAPEQTAAGAIALRIGVSGDYVVRARNAAGSAGALPFRWTPGTPVQELTLRLDAGVSVRGTVVDTRGLSVAGARVLLTRADRSDRFLRGYDYPDLSAETDALGEFRFDHVMPGHHALDVTAEDHARVVVPGIEVASEPVSGIRVVLGRGGAVAGVCVRDGAPVEGLQVSLIGERMLVATTDAEGFFRFDALAEGSYVLKTSGARRELPQLILRSEPVDVVDGQTTEVTLELGGTPVSVSVDGIPEGYVGIVRLRHPGEPLPRTFGPGDWVTADTLASVVAQTYLAPDHTADLGAASPGAYTLEVFLFEVDPAAIEESMAREDALSPRIVRSLVVGEDPVDLLLSLP